MFYNLIISQEWVKFGRFSEFLILRADMKVDREKSIKINKKIQGWVIETAKEIRRRVVKLVN